MLDYVNKVLRLDDDEFIGLILQKFQIKQYFVTTKVVSETLYIRKYICLQ